MRKFIILSIALALCGVVCSAQMSEESIRSYVSSRQSQGASQEQIVMELE